MFVYAANDATERRNRSSPRRPPTAASRGATPIRALPAGRRDAIFPAAVSGGPGDFRVWWMDTRTGRWNVWYSRTTDGGATWSDAIRLSNARRRSRLQEPKRVRGGLRRLRRDRRDERGKVVAIWGEGARYTGPGGAWFVRER